MPPHPAAAAPVSRSDWLAMALAEGHHAAMQIATWNVNSVKARADLLVAWLKESKCDVVCLQELKCEDQAFPTAMIRGPRLQRAGPRPEDLQWRGDSVVAPRWNWCAGGWKATPAMCRPAILRRLILPAGAEPFGLPASICRMAIPLGTEKFDYKLRWMDRLAAHANRLLADEEAVVLAGDYNVIAMRDRCPPSGELVGRRAVPAAIPAEISWFG